MSRIEIVGMVYRSKEFYSFLQQQAQLTRIVGNDSTLKLPKGWVDEYNDPKPNDHYLARVYRCWNYCVESSESEYVCLVNSDMALAPGWLAALERRLDGKTLPTSRLVEPGFLRPGQHAIEIDLGRNPSTFPWGAWRELAADLSEDRVEPGGLFMPCVLHRESFLRCGGYPEGNVNGVSGDKILFGKMAEAGFQHVTCFDSLVYHMQEGEMHHVE